MGTCKMDGLYVFMYMCVPVCIWLCFVYRLIHSLCCTSSLSAFKYRVVIGPIYSDPDIVFSAAHFVSIVTVATGNDLGSAAASKATYMDAINYFCEMAMHKKLLSNEKQSRVANDDGLTANKNTIVALPRPCGYVNFLIWKIFSKNLSK